MSATLFTSKSPKSVRNYKKLLISLPLHVSVPTQLLPKFIPTRSPGWTVVLRAKYTFEALCKRELSLRRGDNVRLLERPGNGWLMVQRIHEIGEGLVPALYLEISVNDSERPVSLEWLNDYQAQSMMRNSVSHVKIKCAYLSGSNNFWYRMDARFHSGRRTYCAMFFEDFVALHSLHVSAGIGGVQQLELPKNIMANSPNSPNTMQSKIAASAQTSVIVGLDKFVQALLRLAKRQSVNIIGDYIDSHCTRKLHVESGDTVPNDMAIADSLVGGSIRIPANGGPARNNSFSPTAPLPPIPGTSLTRGSTLTHPSNAPYQVSNMKYLSYLNQSLKSLQHALNGRPRETCSRRFSTKSEISLNSLIESYAFFSSDELDCGDEEEKKGEEKEELKNSEQQVDFKDVFEVYQTELDSLLTQKKLHDRTSLLEAHSLSFKEAHGTFSSEYGSEYTPSSFTAGTDSNEPPTPTLGNPFMHPLINVLSEDNMSPLEPKKHWMLFASQEEILSSSIPKYSWDPLQHS